MTESARTHLVLYDGDCPFCILQMRLLAWLDWFGCLRILPSSDPSARQAAPGLTDEALSAAIHCVTSAGQIHQGARCFRFIGLRLPLVVPVALALWIPGMIWVADKIYVRVSRNRRLLSRVFGCEGACRVIPARRGRELL